MYNEISREWDVEYYLPKHNVVIYNGGVWLRNHFIGNIYLLYLVGHSN